MIYIIYILYFRKNTYRFREKYVCTSCTASLIHCPSAWANSGSKHIKKGLFGHEPRIGRSGAAVCCRAGVAPTGRRLGPGSARGFDRSGAGVPVAEVGWW